MLKILTFEAVKNGGTTSIYGTEEQDHVYIGLQGRLLNNRGATYDNFGFSINMNPWSYENKNTVVTIEMKRMYTANRLGYSGGFWSGIYPEIFEKCVKELYQDYYCEELLTYFKSISEGGYTNDQDVSINGIDIYYMATGRPVVFTKIE